ncbi:MAG: enoyl-CoA hydratase/isomerase family protein [Pseudomonadales bacterium]
MPPVFTLADLSLLMIEPVSPDWDACLIVDLTGSETLPTDRAAAMGTWLADQPTPVIGIGDEEGTRSDPLIAGVDLVAPAAEADRCREAVARNPDAAAVLMEVLRITAGMPARDALIVESLAYATLQGGPEHGRWLAAERQVRPGRALPPKTDIVELDRQGEVLLVRLNSPETRNSLSVPMRDALTDAFRLSALDDSIQRVVVSGNGPCFSAGGDLYEFGLAANPATAHRVRRRAMPAVYLIPQADRCEFHLHGACIGAGIEIPAFAGTVVASPDAHFRLPEIGMGLIPGAGGCVSIPRRIGRHRAARMALLGDRVSADQALAWGLVDAIAS